MPYYLYRQATSHLPSRNDLIVNMDFIKQLPIEIAEIVISYLDGNDILQCCQVSRDWSNIFDRERTWSILCRQRSWMKDGEERLDSWRSYYWLNHNWRTGVYRRHHQVLSEGGGLQVNLNNQYVIMSHVSGAQIWNFDSVPSFHQNIYCGDCHFQTQTSNKSIVIKLKDSICLYSQGKCDKIYKSIKTISTSIDSRDYEPDLNLTSAIIQTGCDRLVAVQKEEKGHKILFWNLIDGYKYKPMFLQDDVKHIFKIILCNKKLYLVTLNQNEYRIKICDLNNEQLSSEITAFRNVAFGVIPPELQVNEHFIVAFCPTDIGRDLCYSYSPLKVWDSTGQVISSIILNSGRIDYFAFCLSSDLVIYRHSETMIKIWKPITDIEICSFNVEPKICKIDKSVGSLFVLSYDCYFDVWDYKSGKKLYRVMHMDDSYSVIHDRIEINKYYYAKQDRNKKLVTVFSFKNQLSEDINCDNKLFMSDEYKMPFGCSKGIM